MLRLALMRAALLLALITAVAGVAVGYSQESTHDPIYVFVARASGCYRLVVLGHPGALAVPVPQVFRLLPQQDPRRLVEFGGSDGFGSSSPTGTRDVLGAWQVTPLPFPPSSSLWQHSGWEPSARGDAIRVTWVRGYDASVLVLHRVASDTLRGVLEAHADAGTPARIQDVMAIRVECQ